MGYFVAVLYMSYAHNKNIRFNGVLSSLIQLILLVVLFGIQFYYPLDRFWWSNIFTSIIAVLCILTLACFSQGILSNILGRKVFVFLGEVSYSLYLIHYFILFLIIGPYITPYVSSSINIGLKLTLPVVASIIIYKLFEHPLYVFLKNKVSK